MARTNFTAALLLSLVASACTSSSDPVTGDDAGSDFSGSNGSTDGGVDPAPDAPGGGNGSGSGDGTGGGSGSGSGTASGSGPYFTQPMFFNRDVSAVAKAANSDSITSTLSGSGGWGTGKMQIDFTIDVLTSDASTPMRTFTTTGDFYSPDCDHVPMPVPAGGNLESESGYACTGGGDCHLIVFDTSAKKLYEMWRANITSASSFQGGCLAVWNATQAYGDTGRGDGCTSADAAGYPIAPLLFTADEVAAGHIDHAIRFILPNARVKRGYVRPATHSTNTSGSANAPSYGVHFRLRADYPIASLPTEGARVVARAMQKYGMYHADGGNIALTAQSDKHTTHKWAGLLGPLDLQALKVTDFEVIDHGATITQADCNR